MNVIGQILTILTSPDPTKIGRTGRVVMETANTLIIDSNGHDIRVAKSGSAFMLLPSRMVLTGTDMAGRLQDRLGRGRA
jgi:RNase P/RNase MRP subunit p29